MTCLLTTLGADLTPVLAQLSQAHRKFRMPTEESPVGAVVVIFLVVVLLARLAAHIARRLFIMLKQPGQHLTLFAELAKAHTLSRSEQRLLKRLAHREKLADPAVLFVRKQLLGAYAQSQGNRAYQQLYGKLFG